jgi:hypothetical protein
MPKPPENLTPSLPKGKLTVNVIYFDLDIPPQESMRRVTVRLSLNTNEMGEYFLIWALTDPKEINKCFAISFHLT